MLVNFDVTCDTAVALTVDKRLVVRVAVPAAADFYSLGKPRN